MKYIQFAIIACLLNGCSTPFVEYSNSNSILVVEASVVKAQPESSAASENKKKSEDEEVKTYPVPLY